MKIEKKNNEQDFWIEDLRVLNKERKSNIYLSSDKKSIFSLFLSISKKYKKDEIVDFFISKYILKNISQINSTFMKRKDKINSFSFISNQELANKSFNSINACLQYFPEKKKLIVDIISNDEARVKNLFIDKDLSYIGFHFLKENLLDGKNQERILNFSIRSGNKDLFDLILDDYQGRKSRFESIQENPLFWKPLIFNDKNQCLAEYMQDRLIGKEFKVTNEEIKKIRLSNGSNPKFLSHIERLEKKSKNRQISLSF